MENLCGALVERGRVIRIDGDGKCIIASIDRPGIVTLPIALPTGSAIEVGNAVIFCEFADGQGAVFVDSAESGSGTTFKTDKTLSFVDGVLKVNTAETVEKDNTLPVTSAAVHVTVGNIEALLQTI